LTCGGAPAKIAPSVAGPERSWTMATWRVGWRRLAMAAALVAIVLVVIYLIYLAYPAVALWVTGCDKRPEGAWCA
jgi:hypothetical protein